MTMLSVDQIVADRRAQLRAELDPETVERYAEAMRGRAKFPALVVFYDASEGVYYLADGFHRLAAAKEAGRERVHVRVLTGNIRDAMLYAAKANDRHGLPRTNADKRRAVLALLTDLEWRQWSDREIARRCAVSDRLVNRLRAEIEAPLPVIEEPTRMVRRGQVLYPMRIAKRSKRKQQLPVNGEENVGVEVLRTLGLMPVNANDAPFVWGERDSVDLPVNSARHSADVGELSFTGGAAPASDLASSDERPAPALPVSLEFCDLREYCFQLESEVKHLRVILATAGIRV